MSTPNRKAPAKYIKKPYLKGKAFDRSVTKSALAMIGSIALLMLAFLMLGTMMIIGNQVISIILNSILLFGSYLVFYSSGMSRGTTAVNEGEILYHREETGRSYTQEELASCYHPLKGLVIGLLGSLPVFLLAAVFACLTERQMTTMGALPSWVSGITGHPDITQPLSYYMTGASFSIMDIMRILVRMNIMPYVNIIGSSNMDAMFLLERVAPALVLIPGLCYAFGYTQGEKARARIHADIALGKKKLAKKARRDRKRRLQPKQPQNLN